MLTTRITILKLNHVEQKIIHKPELALNFVTLVIHLYFHFTMGLAISEFALNHFAICTL